MHGWSIKKFKELVASQSTEFSNKEDSRAIKLFLQDEARFGRIDNLCSCWVPTKGRTIVGNQLIREYTYAYSTVCPQTGESFSLILPYANENCMDVFMEFVSKEFKEYRIIMVMDGASWHRGDKLKKWENIIPLFQPAYSPEVNPIESLWHHIREKGKFKNTTFHSLKEVESRLVEVISKLDKDTLKPIMLFNWIKAAI
ncbi:hypothetical protein EZS27_018042 [termite gut metagenome]|uniref:Tc1-like transposase DDE domain-containing protein n=1 Tax=termite gut metagenome TaxID=433724 RepID=A0A5J4RJN8_9ZZZZ